MERIGLARVSPDGLPSHWSWRDFFVWASGHQQVDAQVGAGLAQVGTSRPLTIGL
jgi:hypothetical protein